jgi:hypothetical protein
VGKEGTVMKNRRAKNTRLASNTQKTACAATQLDHSRHRSTQKRY